MTEQQTFPKPTIQQQAVLFVFAILALTADQLTKFWIEANIPLGEAIFPFPAIGQYFNFFHIANTGAAFGIAQGSGWFFSIIAFLVAAGIIYYNTQLPPDQRAARITLGFMLGGALGNAIDRFRIGHVTDFINFNLRPLVADYPALDFQLLNWPIFNVADMCVVFGVFVLMYLMYREEQLEQERMAEANIAVEADLQMTAAARQLPQIYTYEQGWTQEPSQPNEPPPTTTPNAQFAFRAVIIFVALAILTTFILLLSAVTGRRRRKRLQKREERRQNG